MTPKTVSNLPTTQRFKYEDYAEAKDWQEALQKFINAVNLFVNPVYTILNGNVTYQNLTIPKLYSQLVTGATPTTFNFTNPLLIQPSAVIIGNIYIPPNFNIHPTVVTQVYWHADNTTIFIDDIVGLTVGTKYFIQLVVF